MRILPRVGWCLVVVDLIAAAAMFFAPESGDAATRGLGQGFGAALACIALAAAALLFRGARGEGRVPPRARPNKAQNTHTMTPQAARRRWRWSPTTTRSSLRSCAPPPLPT